MEAKTLAVVLKYGCNDYVSFFVSANGTAKDNKNMDLDMNALSISPPKKQG